MKNILKVIALEAVYIAISFALSTLLYWGITLCFGIEFKIECSLGVWIVIWVLKIVFRRQ